MVMKSTAKTSREKKCTLVQWPVTKIELVPGSPPIVDTPGDLLIDEDGIQWVVQEDPQKRLYYWNLVTNRTQLFRPIIPK
jgi:hypothetical protein